MKNALFIALATVFLLTAFSCQNTRLLQQETLKHKAIQDSLINYYVQQNEKDKQEQNAIVNQLILENRDLDQKLRKTQEQSTKPENVNSAVKGSSSPSTPAFPWPPPMASASMKVKLTQLGVRTPVRTLGNISSILEDKLDKSQYVEKSYFSVPGGFALATRMERINKDGSFRQPGRWDLNNTKMQSFSLSEYVERLFTAPKGYFRVVVFIVTDRSFAQTNKAASRDEALEWMRSGNDKLDPVNARLPFTSNHQVTALIYEFIKTDKDNPRLSAPSDLTGMDHLKKAKLIR